MNFNSILSLTGALFSIALAVFVLLRDRRSFVHRTFAAGMIALAIEAVFTALSVNAISLAEVLRWQRLRFIAAASLPGIWLLFSLTFGRTNYQEFVAKWRWVILTTFILPLTLVTIFGNALFDEELVLIGYSLGLLRISWAGYFFHLVFLIGAVLILMNLERTLRTSSGRIRWQIKFMVLGLGSLFGVRIYVVSQSLLFRSLNLNLEIVNIGALVVASVLIFISFFRARLLNVEFYLSQSFLYNSFTILFVGIYLLAVGVLAKVATYLKGAEDIPFNAFLVFLALLGLTILLLSYGLRNKVKRFISHHFKRPIYDYRKEWTKFTQETTSVTETKDLCSTVTKMISKTLDIPSVTIWLMDEPQERFMLGSSTIFSEGQHQALKSAGKVVEELVRTMRQKKLPIDFDYIEEDWAAGGMGSNEDFFKQTRIRYCLPLIASGKFLGVMTLGDRVGREGFSVEDFDLLRTIADQTAGNLLNLKLSADLRQAKEMEAFQSISAFFVHDLKNLAAKLSLTMQNLPVHFHNPDFRNDALRTISQSLNKINSMCGRLSSLSQKLDLKLSESDLNELVKNTLSSLDGYLKASPIMDLQPVPRISIDPEQIQKVLTNLILNANEAIKEAGEIKVSTLMQDGFVVLSISDNGCGMSQEFIEKSLFHPFKTTKKQGMGIGLFQCKMIAEAHGGRIEVESEEGKGTTFRVFLPTAEIQGVGCRV
jgi:putative PEP-CTERM system histidine kinase